MPRCSLAILPTIITLHYVTSYYIRQEKFEIKALNTSWVKVENSNFTDNIFSMRIRLLKTIYQYQVLIKGYQRIGRQMKPSPFTWNIDMCQLLRNPLKYNFVIGSFFKSMSTGNNLEKKCPLPANFVYSVDKCELKTDFLPKFFPPGRFSFNVTTLSGKIKILSLEWIWEINHQFFNLTYSSSKSVEVLI